MNRLTLAPGPAGVQAGSRRLRAAPQGTGPGLSCLEICAGAGGQAIGLERAGFSCAAAVEYDPDACETLRRNRPRAWNVVQADVREFDGRPYRGVDLLAGGVPCPPFSVAGRQRGAGDERNLFPEALRLARECAPRAVMLENVPGFAAPRFSGYREQVLAELRGLGYATDWKVLESCSFGVPQLRPRFVLVALRPEAFTRFTWPEPRGDRITAGQALRGLMAEGGWEGAGAWAAAADDVAPTLVGGSRRHGGADLGPTRSRRGWSRLGVDGRSLADAPPGPDAPAGFTPRLTLKMAAAVQSLPPGWEIHGRKTSAYRQIGNAFPPPVARAVALQVSTALGARAVPRPAGRQPAGTACPPLPA